MKIGKDKLEREKTKRLLKEIAIEEMFKRAAEIEKENEELKAKLEFLSPMSEEDKKIVISYIG